MHVRKQHGFDKECSSTGRSILADAAVRPPGVCGNRACATARPSGQIRAAVVVCGGARRSNLAAHAGRTRPRPKTHPVGVPDIANTGARGKKLAWGWGDLFNGILNSLTYFRCSLCLALLARAEPEDASQLRKTMSRSRSDSVTSRVTRESRLCREHANYKRGRFASGSPKTLAPLSASPPTEGGTRCQIS